MPPAGIEDGAGGRVQQIRKEGLGISQGELAALVGVAKYQTVSNWETGAVDIRTLRAVASLLDHSDAWLQWLAKGGEQPRYRVNLRPAALSALEGIRVGASVSDPSGGDVGPSPEEAPKLALLVSETPEIAMRVGDAVAQAIQRTIDRNELWYEGPGKRDLISCLHRLAQEFNDRGIETCDLEDAIRYLKGRKDLSE